VATVLASIAFLILVALLTLFYYHSQKPVHLIVDGQTLALRTHQRTVKGLLDDVGLALRPEDVVLPGLEAPLPDTVVVQRARPVVLQADGETTTWWSHARQVSDVLRLAGVRLGDWDELTLDGRLVERDAPLPKPTAMPLYRWGRLQWPVQHPVHISLRRAVPVHVLDNGVPATFYTTATTLGTALHQQGVALYLGDRITPDLGSRVVPGLQVTIQRSVPVTILVDGRIIKTRTRAQTVADVFDQERVVLIGEDRSEPEGETAIRPELVIRVVRVRQEIELEQEPIPFETVWQADEELELDQQRLVQSGGPGVTLRRFRVLYEDGQVVSRAQEDEWVGREPQTKIIAYGTRIVSRPVETEAGVKSYWRKIRVLATSYSAATAGKDLNHPEYGITYLGWPMRYGIVAVDPTVIPLRTEIYVPGYGLGVAGDTGGAIKGRHIDLGYNEDNLVLWYKWVDVYLLDPPPPRDQIRWVLPNWPREPRR